MKIYNYKNGEHAFFYENVKHLISENEIEALISDEFHITTLAYYIERKIRKSKYMTVPFPEVLAEYRKGEYSIEKKEINGWEITVVRDNGEVVALESKNENGDNNICLNTDSWFETAKKECEVL